MPVGYSKLQELANEHGTPLYVMDMDRVRDNYLRLSDAIPFCTVKYAAKSNNHSDVLEEMSDYVDSVVCGSSHEAISCYDSGFDIDQLQVTAVSPKEESISHLVDFSKKDDSFTVTLNSLDTLRRLNGNGYSGDVLIRLTPNPSFRSQSRYKEGSLSKFGMPPHEINEAISYLRTTDMDLVGFHNHLGGKFMTESIDNYVAHVQDTIDRATEWLPLSQIDVLNFGGGFGIPKKPSEEELDLDKLSESLHEVLPLDSDVEFVVEPGRYIAGDAGQLLTTVNTVKETQYGRFVGVDAGMSEFPRPMMFDAYHHIRIVENPMFSHRHTVEQTVAGPTCSGADVFASNREFGKAKVDDLLAIEDVGAYGIVMSNQFHAYPLPNLVLA